MYLEHFVKSTYTEYGKIKILKQVKCANSKSACMVTDRLQNDCLKNGKCCGYRIVQ